MTTIPRSLSNIIVRLFIAMGVVAAFIGVGAGTAAADEVTGSPVVADPIPDPIASDPIVVNDPITDPILPPTTPDPIVVPDPILEPEPVCDPADPGAANCVAPYPYPWSAVWIEYDVNGDATAAAIVYDDQGMPQGLPVQFTIVGDATFTDGQTSVFVYPDDTGRASAPIVRLPDNCAPVGFDVYAAFAYADSLIPLEGSPVPGNLQPIEGCFTPQLSIILAPTNSGPVYANGVDSWSGIITLSDPDGAPILGASFDVGIFQLFGDVIQFTDNVTITDFIDYGNGTYAFLFTSLYPGEYSVGVAWQDLSNYASWMTFYGLPDSPTVITANANTIAGFTMPMATVQISDSLGNVLSVVEANDAGFWGLGTPAGTPSQQITVSILDEFGNILASTTAWLDTDIPGPPRVDRATVTEVAGDAGAAEPNATILVNFPNGSVWSAVVAADGSYSVSTPEGTTEGTVVTVSAADSAGNVSDPTTVTLTAEQPITCWYVVYLRAVLKIWFWWL